MADFNNAIIEEFRSSAGKVGGPFEGAPMVLVHHKGAKSGTERVTPLVSLPEGDVVHIFASAGGAPKHPAWYHNLVANPEIEIEVPVAGGTATVEVTAESLAGDERNRLFDAQKEAMPQFAEYEAGTDRVIPVVALRPR
ncbi:MAG: nitroreductase family deazaflavin-dependent oxidoreductase [Actinomycetia bacterium]|nr:nitroreductase family deazaflavin-dependent oxidoreductase [Actinomycetes bacterium]